MVLFKEVIPPGSSKELNLSFAKLHTNTPIDVPIFVERSLYEGPTVLFTAGIHGDEVNGIEIVRQLVSKGINKPKIGTTITIPIINIFGFLQKVREFPDGRDLNRSFPGSKSGSLAARVAHKLMNHIIPHVDYCLDFHTGGSSRFNAPHIRVEKGDEELIKLAGIFNAPFILQSKNLKKTFRYACSKKGVPMLLFEGGKSNSIDNVVSNTGVNGSKRVLHHLGMLNSKFKVSSPKNNSLIITHSIWVRAHASGMFKPAVKVGSHVKQGEVIGHITDPYGKIHYWIKSTNNGYVFNVNESPLVYQGDALFHISTGVT
ncbi:MAG: succinylglutamate desuccinylase/aspartoacylase family protein [Flavobacteriaceae bacterium]|nr:succinylglutamate desuccinylase/aspartoacylase family protein [Flavobacteriaceae bacterium]NNJ82610.1 succinylglutamate desuccinylase/aspartoacylase family protein [Flavobacteriaceae bacterium]NNK53148.1 succinylglutamate desuccinylase/aspartoacylase family protein [Flavobacteriaceae bacterium]NNM08972.1 succinylglutamate desuccinylase/aspartoacylase family protein [Flavobacteriaceae bacterium]